MDAAEFSSRRQRAGMTQSQLAIACGIAQPHISAYESGGRTITPDVANRVEAATRQRPTVLLRRYRNEIRDLVSAHRGSNVRVFGSAARGIDTLDSDLDLLVTFLPDTHLGEVGVLMSELSDLLGIDVDVVSEGALVDDRFSRRVLSDAVPL
ncbi:helix-turn-helix domain-containing protein [Gordonia sp. HNM0687]|uniref:Helix-turn-helix domain-containing protein n=1 Tax=Gordonia mangrovi TaxID=2665643 RepID=A0A6L7GTM2_9ACTN|nr:helix-turn-helix domain-containing protein [Gordonia mangrovi]MXP22025.1 helix-turn-helix domain-containing protein [Gordonia mangrovi]UVF78045.1 helix-turn-helix domain-containing protein [Gordonia mangrovi]